MNEYADLSEIGSIFNIELNEPYKKTIRHGNEVRKERKGLVIDAAETAKRGSFIEVPDFLCRNIE